MHIYFMPWLAEEVMALTSSRRDGAVNIPSPSIDAGVVVANDKAKNKADNKVDDHHDYEHFAIDPSVEGVTAPVRFVDNGVFSFGVVEMPFNDVVKDVFNYFCAVLMLTPDMAEGSLKCTR